MDLDVRSVDTLYALGHWLLENGRDGDAIHVFRTMMCVAPSDERSWLGLAHCHELRDETALAERLYVLGEAAAPHSFRCPLALARLRRRINDPFADRAYEAAETRALAIEEIAIASAI